MVLEPVVTWKSLLKKIGELVMSELSHLDDVAYIRFASVYRQFKDVSGFMTTLEEMMNKED